jgi:AAA domain
VPHLTAKKPEPYPLDAKFERAVVFYACSNADFYQRIGHALDPEALETEAAKLAVKTAHDVAKDADSGPDSPMTVLQRLRRWMGEGKATQEQWRSVGCYLEDAEDAGLPTAEAVIAELVPILRRRLQADAVEAAMSEYAKRGDMQRVAEMIAGAKRLGAATRNTPAATPAANRVTLAAVMPEKLNWLWRGRIPYGKLTILDGDPGLGKSTLLLDLAARVTRGRPMPGDTGDDDPRDVILITYEDGLADTIRPRLEAAGGDAARVHAIQSIPCGDGTSRLPAIPDDVQAIATEVAKAKAAMVIVDPLMAALSGRVDSAKDQHIRRALTPLAAMAEQLDVAVVCVRHLNKGGATSGPTALYRGGGSIGISGAARSVLLVARDPDDPDARILASVKMNLAAAPPAIGFALVPAVGDPDVALVVWKGESQRTADELVQVAESRQERSRLDEACDFLRDVLSDGPRLVTLVEKEAREAGLAPATLRRAKDALGVVARKSTLADGKWVWALPPRQGDHDRLDRLRTVRPTPGPTGDSGGRVEGNQGDQDDHPEPEGCEP